MAEPVQHVFINHDTNLLDVTIATSRDAKPTTTDATTTKQHDAAVKAHGSQAPPPTTETLHTTTEHPFLTTDHGFVDAAALVPGEQVRQLDGSVGVVFAIKMTPGAGVRYNLTVQDLHTYAVGDGQWVVHNTEGEGQCTPTDLFRIGRANDPKFNSDDLRIGKDATLDGNGNIKPKSGGYSTSSDPSVPKGTKSWKLPAGTQLPDGVQVTNDQGDHWLIEPSVPMSPDDFSQRIRGLPWIRVQ